MPFVGGDSEHIKIKKREDGHSGIDVVISSDTKGETVHIPVVITKTGITDVVYNDFMWSRVRKSP